MVILMNPYDNPEFFAEYAKMSRSQYGLDGAGEWHQLEPMFPDLAGKVVLDLGCGTGLELDALDRICKRENRAFPRGRCA